MLLARVTGTVVATSKEPRIEGIKLLVLEKVDPATMEGKRDYVVAMDAVGAGPGEVVVYVAGSSSRLTAVTEGKPSDATVIGIVDAVELGGRVAWRKGAA